MRFSPIFFHRGGKNYSTLSAIFAFWPFAIFASYYTILLTKTILDRNVMTAVLQWPKWIMYAGIPFAFLLTCYRLVKDIRRNLQELKDIANGEENSQGDLNPGLGDI